MSVADMGNLEARVVPFLSSFPLAGTWLGPLEMRPEVQHGKVVAKS